MRYIVKKVKEDEFEFTHIWEQEGLDGNKVEVIRGRNIIKLENLIKSIEDLKSECEYKRKFGLEELQKEIDTDIELITNNINELEKMLKATEEC